MLEHLETYYKEKGILSTDFACRYKGDCKGNCETFTGPKSAFVSRGYEQATDYPRLLFLSLARIKARSDMKERNPQGVRRREENKLPISVSKPNPHWYHTHELAWYILKRFKPALTLDEVKEYFAHTNSAKCYMDELDKDKLFENCRGYLKGELDILHPDLLVTQGKEAKEAIEFLRLPKQCINKFSSIVTLNDRPVFWSHTHQPASGKHFWDQRKYAEKSWRDRDQAFLQRDAEATDGDESTLGWRYCADLMYNFIQER